MASRYCVVRASDLKGHYVSRHIVTGCGVTQIFAPYSLFNGPGSVVRTATGYELDGAGIESWWGRDFPHLSSPALGPTQPPVQWVPEVKSGRGLTLTPYPLLMPWS